MATAKDSAPAPADDDLAALNARIAEAGAAATTKEAKDKTRSGQ